MHSLVYHIPCSGPLSFSEAFLCRSKVLQFEDILLTQHSQILRFILLIQLDPSFLTWTNTGAVTILVVFQVVGPVLAMFHGIFSGLIDLWVIEIKSPGSFAHVHVVRRNHVNGARNADQAARTCERFGWQKERNRWKKWYCSCITMQTICSGN